MIVRVRVDGVTRELASVPKTMQEAVVSRLKVMAKLDIAERRLPQDGRSAVRLADDPIDLRVAVLPTTHGEKVVVRILQRSSTHVTLPELGMSQQAFESFVRAIDQPFGCVIACGPTGAGKTTTLYAALDRLNSTRARDHDDRGPGRVRAGRRCADPGQRQARPDLRARTAHDPARRSRRAARGRDSRRRDGPDRRSGGYDRPPRAHHRARPDGGRRLRAPAGHGPGAVHARQRRQLRHLTAPACACSAPPAAARRAERGRASRAGPRPEDVGALYHPVGCRACGGSGYHGRTGIYEVLPGHAAASAS